VLAGRGGRRGDHGERCDEREPDEREELLHAGASLESRALTPLSTRKLRRRFFPVSELFEQDVAGRRCKIVLAQGARQAHGFPELLDVGDAAGAGVALPLEACALRGGQRAPR
jgi:hypothetical protein